MLFNSIEFAIFLPIVFALYWSINNLNLKIQNALLLVASYLFYGWWDWRFLSLIIASSLVDYSIAKKLGGSDNQKKRKTLLLMSLAINLGLLGFFKYCNFFISSFVDAFLLFGKRLDVHTLNIVLPVGISFYTFQTLSYTIDVYRKKINPTNDILAFFTFVAFFPQLVAGPIERAGNLLAQFYQKRMFDYDKAVDGLRQILSGLLKKTVIADNCAIYVNYIFKNYQTLSGSTLLLGAIYFAFQIYGDFSGYSDIAIGTARLFGFDIMRNFAYPYFSRDIAEFWRRWHISLTTWFRDYVYIPLGGSLGSKWRQIRNVIIIFLVSGFWHGANWTFIMWGLVNVLCFLPLLLTNKNRVNLDTVAKGKALPSFKETLQIVTTFLMICIAWIFFRAENIGHAFSYINRLFSTSLFYRPPDRFLKFHIVIIIVFVVLEWIQREKEHLFQINGIRSMFIRWSMYYVALFIVIHFSSNQQSFIYFQF